MNSIVRVIDQTDEMYDFVGFIMQINSPDIILVYFDEIGTTLAYKESQLEYMGTE